MKIPQPLLIIPISILLLTGGCFKSSDLEIVGTWQLNPEKTVQLAFDKGVFPSDEGNRMIQRFQNKADPVAIIVTPDSIHANGEQAPYEITIDTGEEVIVETEMHGQRAVLTFRDFDGESIQILSTSTDDMDFLVWDKQ